MGDIQIFPLIIMVFFIYLVDVVPSLIFYNKSLKTLKFINTLFRRNHINHPGFGLLGLSYNFQWSGAPSKYNVESPWNDE